jgi:hypothetical protein
MLCSSQTSNQKLESLFTIIEKATIAAYQFLTSYELNSKKRFPILFSMLKCMFSWYVGYLNPNDWGHEVRECGGLPKSPPPPPPRDYKNDRVKTLLLEPLSSYSLWLVLDLFPQVCLLALMSLSQVLGTFFFAMQFRIEEGMELSNKKLTM